MREPDMIISERAAERVAEISDSAGPEGAGILRIEVQGGGCFGFRYDFEMVKEPAPGDRLLVRDRARVAVDEMSLPLLVGARLEFEDELVGSRFVISNPNATGACGCGTSFTLG